MKKIYVIRHGLTEMNKKGFINGAFDDTLLPEGEEQARASIPLLPQTIKRIYCSSLLRTRQTAAIINDALHLPISFHKELQEVDFGSTNGTPFLPEDKKKHMTLTFDWHDRGGESVDDVRARILKILKIINAENADGEALIVAHGGTIRMLTFLETGEILNEIANAGIFTFDLDAILKNR